MYCERCNIDFDESLRYCKWCGETLQERRRVTSELYTCPACSSQVRQGWVFCKSCGARLGAEPTTPPPTELFCPRCGNKMPASSSSCSHCGEDFTQIFDSKPLQAEPDATPSAGLCWSCGEGLEPNSLYCKSCGSAVYAGPAAAEQPQILCSNCKSYNPAGSVNCRVCGAPLTSALGGQAPPSGWAAKPTMVDSDSLPHTLTDRSAQAPTVRQTPVGESAPTRRTPVPPAEIDSGAHTFIFSTSEGTAKAETTDDLASSAPEGAEVESESEAEAAWRRESAETNMLPGVAGAALEQPSPTTTLKKTRITAPVEGEPTSSIDEGGEQTAPQAVPEQPPVTLSPMPSEPADQPTVALHEGQQAPAASPQPPAASPQPPLSARSVERSVGEPATLRQMGVGVAQPAPAPRPPSPRGRSRKSPVAIVSVIVGLAVVASAGFVLWWYISGGTRPKPAPPKVEVETPAPAPPAPVQPPAPPPVPEGMLKVPGGTYTIGRDAGDPLEQPSHLADVKPFFIDRTEVTNEQYLKFIEVAGHPAPITWKDGKYPAGDDKLPVTEVTWQDAASYAEWAGKRLPTEEEWEAAARGSDKRIYPWGNQWRPGIANIGLKPGKIEEVGKYPDSASPVGALDMIGNVWEWTADEISPYPGSRAPVTTEPGVTYRVIRGGAFDGDRTHDASYRGYLDASKPYPKVGFRCVKDAK